MYKFSKHHHRNSACTIRGSSGLSEGKCRLCHPRMKLRASFSSLKVKTHRRGPFCCGGVSGPPKSSPRSKFLSPSEGDVPVVSSLSIETSQLMFLLRPSAAIRCFSSRVSGCFPSTQNKTALPDRSVPSGSVRYPPRCTRALIPGVNTP